MGVKLVRSTPPWWYERAHELRMLATGAFVGGVAGATADVAVAAFRDHAFHWVAVQRLGVVRQAGAEAGGSR